jgi:hypothetical protein
MKTPDELRDDNVRLQAERDAAVRERAELATSLAQLTGMVASTNDKLDQVVSMLRRREAELKRLAAENRKLRRKLGLEPDPEPTVAPIPEPAEDDPGMADDTGAPPASEPDAGSPGNPTSALAAKAPRPRSAGGRRPPPEHLPSDTESHEVASCRKCNGPVFNHEVLVTRVYTVVPSYVRCREIRRTRAICADPSCVASTTAAMPPMPCNRALYDCRFLAWLVVMKFELLVPLDRVRLHLESQGIRLAMGSLVHLIARAAHLADAIDGEHMKQLRAGDYMCFDGTGLKVLMEGQDKAWNGYLEVFTRDELSVFQFAMTKHADGLSERLHSFDGILVCDAESRNVAGARGLTLSNCNAHPRRAFEAAESAQPILAARGRRYLAALFRLEKEAKALGLEGEPLVEFRRTYSAEVLCHFRAWLTEVLAMNLPPSDPLRSVVAYYDRHFDDLTRFVDHAELPLDNNAAEREFQRHAKLRLASLFAGSPEGAHRWATLLGVVRTAQKCGVDVFAYLTWLFERRGTHRDHFGLTAAELTPMAYKRLLREEEAAAA